MTTIGNVAILRGGVIGHLALVRDRETEARLVERLAEPPRPIIVSFVNAHGFNLSWRDEAFARDIAASNLVLRDGVGMSLALSLLGGDPGLNMNGTDLIPKLIRRFAGRPVALLGTREPWLGRAAERTSDLGADVVLRLDGFRPEAEYVEAVLRERPSLILLGMGMPKQERVAVALREALDYPALIVNGGAVLDFLAERFPRAPTWMRSAGLEWLFRLVLEPARLYGRYVAGAGPFFTRVVRLRLQGLYAP